MNTGTQSVRSENARKGVGRRNELKKGSRTREEEENEEEKGQEEQDNERAHLCFGNCFRQAWTRSGDDVVARLDTRICVC